MIKSTLKKIIFSTIITCLSCLILSIIIFSGQYFQNWLSSAYAPHKQIILVGWFIFFIYCGICLLFLWQSNSKEKNYLFFFAIQFFAFAVYLISIYCFSAYILAMVSSIISVIFSTRLVITLFRYKQYFMMSLLLVILFINCYCAYSGLVCSSLEYGFWKE